MSTGNVPPSRPNGRTIDRTPARVPNRRGPDSFPGRKPGNLWSVTMPGSRDFGPRASTPADAERLDKQIEADRKRDAEALEAYRNGLTAAMEADGWPPNDPVNYCDISAAIRAGFPLCAAHLLTGATECPHTESFLRQSGGLPKGADGWPVDWPQWVEWFKANTVRCPKCRTFVFTDEGHPGNCGNCLATIPEPDSPDDEE